MEVRFMEVSQFKYIICIGNDNEYYARDVVAHASLGIRRASRRSAIVKH